MASSPKDESPMDRCCRPVLLRSIFATASVSSEDSLWPEACSSTRQVLLSRALQRSTTSWWGTTVWLHRTLSLVPIWTCISRCILIMLLCHCTRPACAHIHGRTTGNIGLLAWEGMNAACTPDD